MAANVEMMVTAYSSEIVRCRQTAVMVGSVSPVIARMAAESPVVRVIKSAMTIPANAVSLNSAQVTMIVSMVASAIWVAVVRLAIMTMRVPAHEPAVRTGAAWKAVPVLLTPIAMRAGFVSKTPARMPA